MIKSPTFLAFIILFKLVSFKLLAQNERTSETLKLAGVEVGLHSDINENFEFKGDQYHKLSALIDKVTIFHPNKTGGWRVGFGNRENWDYSNCSIDRGHIRTLKKVMYFQILEEMSNKIDSDINEIKKFYKHDNLIDDLLLRTNLTLHIKCTGFTPFSSELSNKHKKDLRLDISYYYLDGVITYAKVSQEVGKLTFSEFSDISDKKVEDFKRQPKLKQKGNSYLAKYGKSFGRKKTDYYCSIVYKSMSLVQLCDINITESFLNQRLKSYLKSIQGKLLKEKIINRLSLVLKEEKIRNNKNKGNVVL
ncbi:hypothetical protein [Pseudoalteromonas phenolica]|uniref:hypothetical protein n=1 Tax=Pseudoalteromonas phenolica TaxID=161398 RepID=UPI00384EC44D